MTVHAVALPWWNVFILNCQDFQKVVSFATHAQLGSCIHTYDLTSLRKSDRCWIILTYFNQEIQLTELYKEKPRRWYGYDVSNILMANEMKLCSILRYRSLKICSVVHLSLRNSWNLLQPHKMRVCVYIYIFFIYIKFSKIMSTITGKDFMLTKKLLSVCCWNCVGVFMLWLNNARTAGTTHVIRMQNSWWWTFADVTLVRVRNSYTLFCISFL